MLIVLLPIIVLASILVFVSTALTVEDRHASPVIPQGKEEEIPQYNIGASQEEIYELVVGADIGSNSVLEEDLDSYNYTVYLNPSRKDLYSNEILSVDIMLKGELNYTQVTAEIAYDADLFPATPLFKQFESDRRKGEHLRRHRFAGDSGIAKGLRRIVDPAL